MSLAASMTAYITSNFITGESLEVNVRIEATIAGVREHDFGADVKPVVDLEDGRRIPLNQDRLRALIGGFGPNPNNWIGRTIVVSRGMTTYAGKPVPCVVVEPVVATRIVADPLQRRIAIEGDKSAPAESLSEINPPPIEFIDDDIPF
jgi:hypothetical protein